MYRLAAHGAGRDAGAAQVLERTEEFVRADLGDARTFNLGSPKKRAPRMVALRKTAKG